MEMCRNFLLMNFYISNGHELLIKNFYKNLSKLLQGFIQYYTISIQQFIQHFSNFYTFYKDLYSIIQYLYNILVNI